MMAAACGRAPLRGIREMNILPSLVEAHWVVVDRYRGNAIGTARSIRIGNEGASNGPLHVAPYVAKAQRNVQARLVQLAFPSVAYDLKIGESELLSPSLKATTVPR